MNKRLKQLMHIAAQEGLERDTYAVLAIANQEIPEMEGWPEYTDDELWFVVSWAWDAIDAATDKLGLVA